MTAAQRFLYGRAVLQEAIGALTFTIFAGLLLAAVAQWNVLVGAAAITVVVTAALLIRTR